MRSTAGTHIISWNTHDSDLTFNFNFTPVIHILQLFFCRIEYFDRNICKNRFIGFKFYLSKFILGQRTIHIQSTIVVCQMKSHIIITKLLMNQSRNNMLCCMLLHSRKSFFPVNCSGDFCANFQFFLDIMINNSFFFLYINNFNII